MKKDISRKEDIDILKALLIFFLIATHSRLGIGEYANWFHMPGFFILSGLFFTPKKNFDEFLSYFKKSILKLLVPYFIWKLIMYFLTILIFHQDRDIILQWSYFKECLFNTPLVHNDFFIVFWFVPCLWFTQVIIALLSVFIKENLLFIIITGAMIFAVIEKIFFPNYSYVFSIFRVNHNMLLGGLFYFYVCGYVIYKRIEKYADNIKFVILSLALMAVVIINHKLGIVKHSFYLSSDGSSGNLIYDFMIPLLCIFCLHKLALELNKLRHLWVSNFFKYVGLSTLIIMYAHIPGGRIARIIYEALGLPSSKIGFIFYSVIGAFFIPLIISYVLNKNRILKRLFWGV